MGYQSALDFRIGVGNQTSSSFSAAAGAGVSTGGLPPVRNSSSITGRQRVTPASLPQVPLPLPVARLTCSTVVAPALMASAIFPSLTPLQIQTTRKRARISSGVSLADIGSIVSRTDRHAVQGRAAGSCAFCRSCRRQSSGKPPAMHGFVARIVSAGIPGRATWARGIPRVPKRPIRTDVVPVRARRRVFARHLGPRRSRSARISSIDIVWQ